MKLKIKMPGILQKFKLKFKLKGIVNLSERQKKIISTAAVALAVCAFYIWLGIGLGRYMPESSHSNLVPLLIMYCIFPAFVLFFSIKRVVNILMGKEDREVIESAAKASSLESEQESVEIK